MMSSPLVHLVGQPVLDCRGQAAGVVAGHHAEVIAEDFGLTRSGIDRMRVWLADNNPDALAAMNDRPVHMSGAHPDAMRQILTDLDEQHGGVRGYLSSIGVGDALLADLAARLT